MKEPKTNDKNKPIIPDYKTMTKQIKAEKTSLSLDLINRIASKVRDGNYPSVACMSEGIHHQRFHDWMMKGSKERDGSEALVRIFYDTINQAEADSIVDMNHNIKNHAKGTYKADAFRLERRFNNKYGKKQQIEHVGNPLEGLALIIDQSKKELKLNDNKEPETLTQVDTVVKVGSVKDKKKSELN